ncbi:MAG: hypothetical protein IJJ28_03565 [Lentisphaeria bacterium]|nr:hypothetical protein [Lentisphaeria bacterium]
MKNNIVVFRFNMIEIALALVILAIGLSSVLVLFPVGLNAGKSSVADNNLADIAERLAAYLQTELTVPAHWKENGNDDGGISVKEFVAEPGDSALPETSEFTAVTAGSGNKLDGLLSCTKGDQTYYLYRQYANIASDSTVADADRAVDFEAMIRVGLDTDSLKDEQYYPLVAADASDTQGQRKLNTAYPRTNPNEPSATRLNVSMSDLLKLCYKTLIVEISWPADAPWSKREKRIFRLELFNENFVPYPQNTTP